MAMFDREKDKLPPFKYNVGDKIMGYCYGIGVDMLVGGEIIERKQSTSYLNDNKYNVKLESESCEECEEGKVPTWWLGEKSAIPFKQDVWNRVVMHWLEYGRAQRKAYFEHIRMHRALRGEPDDISDEQLEKEIEEIRKVK